MGFLMDNNFLGPKKTQIWSLRQELSCHYFISINSFCFNIYISNAFY